MASLSLSTSFLLSLLFLTSFATAPPPPSPAPHHHPKPPTPAPAPTPPPPPHHHHHHPKSPTPPPPPHHHHRHHPEPPTLAPTPPPPPHHHHPKPPCPAPTPPPPPHHHHPEPPTPAVMKNVAIQGYVYCKDCKYRGVDTLIRAAPLAGAVVKLLCNNTGKGVVEQQQKTDESGYFFFKPRKLTTSGLHKCKVFLVSSPAAACNVPTNLHGGVVGAILSRFKPPVDAPKLPFELFIAGPFAFEAAKKLPCHY